MCLYVWISGQGYNVVLGLCVLLQPHSDHLNLRHCQCHCLHKFPMERSTPTRHHGMFRGPVVCTAGPERFCRPGMPQLCRIQNPAIAHTICSWGQEENSKFSIWRFLKIHWGAQRKRSVIKKSNNTTMTSSICIIKTLGRYWLQAAREFIWLSNKPWWLNHSVQLQLMTNQILFPAAHNGLFFNGSFSWHNSRPNLKKWAPLRTQLCYVEQASKCNVSAYPFYKLHFPKWQRRISSGSPSPWAKAWVQWRCRLCGASAAPGSPVATHLQEQLRCSALVCPIRWVVLGNPGDWLPQVGTSSRIYVPCSTAAHNYKSLSPNGCI